MANIIQEAQPVTKAELIISDGETNLCFRNAEAKISKVTRKDKDGNVIETGVTRTEFVFRKTKAQLENGEGIAVQNEDGSISLYSGLKFVGEAMDADAIAAVSANKRFDRLVKDLRLFVGLSKSNKAVAESDKLTSKDIENWMNGLRKIKGYHFDELPSEFRDKASKVYADSIKKTGAKPPTMAQLAELAAMAAENGTPLSDEWHAAFEAAKARAARMGKGKAAKAASADVELTEQSDI